MASSTSIPNAFDVVVVGGGLAGLTAACDLLQRKPECNIVVLEGRDRIGGRIFPVSLKGSNGSDMFDLGGQWVSRKQKNITKLIETFKLETYDQYFEGSKLTEMNIGEVTSHKNEIASLGFISSLEVYLTIKKIENMCKEVPLEEPEKCRNAEEWDGMTLQTFKEQSFWTTNAKRLFDVAVSTIFGMAPSQISLLYFLHYCNAAGGFSPLIESENNGGAQERKVKGGLYQVCSKLQDVIGEKNILLNHAVTTLVQDDNGIKITTSNGKSFQSKYCILAIPPQLAGKIKFVPDLPHGRQRLMSQMLMGSYTKFVATYATSFWRDAGLSGELFRFTGNKESCCSSPVGAVFDGTTAEKSAALIGFFSGYAASYWAPKSDDEKKQAVLETLRSFFGSKAGKPIDFAIKDWSLDEWSGGCPVSIITPGGITQYGDLQREPFKRVHWAGTETATIWRGYADGAVESGRRAAREVIERLKSTTK